MRNAKILSKEEFQSIRYNEIFHKEKKILNIANFYFLRVKKNRHQKKQFSQLVIDFQVKKM